MEQTFHSRDIFDAIACTTSGGEGGPLHLVDGQGDAQIAPSLLQVLCQRHMVAGIVGAVLQSGVKRAVPGA